MKRCGLTAPLLLVCLLLLVLVEASRAEDDDDEHRTITKETSVRVGRTFGQKRIQFMLMPMIYKMGVMMTMLTVLTVISLKGLMVGVMLLVLKLSAIFGKFYSLFSSSQHHGHSPSGWAPPPQPVHVHLHNSGGGSMAYGGWETAGPGSGPPDEHYYYKG